MIRIAAYGCEITVHRLEAFLQGNARSHGCPITTELMLMAMSSSYKVKPVILDKDFSFIFLIRLI